jgi:ADP-heptose:LPS heptosyltransferase
MMIHYDCRYYLGHKPCAYRRECDGCPHYAPVGKRILIVKLAAMGDVLRTTTLLRGLRRAYPGCHITWLTEPNVVTILQGIKEIDRLLPYTFENVLPLRHETFDILYCFDKEPKAIALTLEVKAEKQIGFGMTKYGNVTSLSPSSDYMFELGINDHLKFRVNTKTYPELIFECAELPYPEPQEYILPDLTVEIEEGRAYLESLGVSRDAVKVGLNTGAGDMFAPKKWTEEGYAELSDRLARELGATVLLLGGPAETERNERIAKAAACTPVNTGTHHTVRRFAGIVGNLDLMVTGDTLAMHLAIGLKIPVLVILGATCAQEIELYGRGSKIVSDCDCSPCYLRVCPKEVTCMQSIPSGRVFDAAARLLRRQG